MVAWLQKSDGSNVQDHYRWGFSEPKILKNHVLTKMAENFSDSKSLSSSDCQQKTECKSPCYFEPQKILAAKIIERIRLMLRHHQDRELEDFKEFDFQVYTSRSITLKEQTQIRLENPDSECIPPSYYEKSVDIRPYTEERVQLYQLGSKEKTRHDKLLQEARENSDKLFLIVADEAHWGITSADEEGKAGAHDKLINCWDSKVYNNVIILLVTATAYNLLTEDTRLPFDVFCAESLLTGKLNIVYPAHDTNDCKVERLMNTCGKDVTDLVGPKKPLHHVQWTETYSTRLEGGLKMTIRSLATSSAKESSKPIYLGPKHESNSDFVKFTGTDKINSELTITVKGKNDRVQLFDAKERQLAVKRSDDSLGYDIGFMSSEFVKNNPEVICDFEMAMTFGEDVFALYPVIPNCREKFSLYYDKTSEMVKVHPKPQSVILGNHEVLVDLPVTDLFFIHEVEDINNSGNNSYRYLSLNYYYNTIWNDNTAERKIRCDDSFETLCQVMLEEERETVHNQTDVFIAEYCIFVLILSEFAALLTMNSARLMCTMDIMTEMIKTAKNINQKVNTFCEALNKHFFDENIIDESAIRDVLATYKSSMQLQSHDQSEFWKSTLKACLFGSHKSISKLSEEIHRYENCDLLTLLEHIGALKQTIIRTYETGKIISDVMRMTEDNAGQLQGYMKVIRVNKVQQASRLFESLNMARKIASKDSPFLFEIIRDCGKSKLQDLYQGGPDDQKYHLHVLLQQQHCATVKKENMCHCADYISDGTSVKCVNCNHPHNPVLKFEDLNGLPCIVILVDKGKMGDTFPPSFNCMDLRICCSERKKGAADKKSDYVLSSTVQELGRLCRYNKSNDPFNIPYVLVPRNRMEHLKCETSENQDCAATIYSSFLLSGKIDRFASADRRSIIAKNETSTSSGDIKIPFKATRKSFDNRNTEDKLKGPAAEEPKGDDNGPSCANNSTPTNETSEDCTENTVNGDVATSGIHQTKTNMILLNAEPQCGKTGTYCRVIAELRKVICKEFSFDDMETESESSDISDDEEDPVPQTKRRQQCTDEETIWQYPYHIQMAKEKLINKVSRNNKYTRIHGAWVPGKSPDKRPIFQALGNKKFDDITCQASTCQAPYKSETYSHTCSVCPAEECSSPITIKVYMKDYGYTCILYMSNITQSSQLVVKLGLSNIRCAPILTSASPESVRQTPDLKTWIFVPTSGRAKTACLNLKHTMCGPDSHDDDTEVFKTYVQILVVHEKDFNEYCAIWGPKVTAILQLPNCMKDDTDEDLSAENGKIGYSRHFIQMFAQQLNLPYIFMLDDNVWFVHEAKFDGGKVCRPSGDSKVDFRCVPLYKVLRHMENQFNINTPKPTGAFEPWTGASLSDLETYTGPRSNYAVLGVRKARKGSQKVRLPFKKAQVYSLVLLNVEATKDKNVEYPKWEVREDIEFNARCDRNELWVCKYNRFLLSKKRMRMPPALYFWDDTTKLVECHGPAEHEVRYLSSWINYFTEPRIIETGIELKNESLTELMEKVENKRHRKNDYLVCVGGMLQNASRKALQETLETTIAATGNTGLVNYIIAISTEICMQCSVTKKADYDSLLRTIFKEGFVLHIATSHNVTEFKVKTVLLSVQGEVKPQGVNDDIERKYDELKQELDAKKEECDALKRQISMLQREVAKLKTQVKVNEHQNTDADVRGRDCNT